MNQTELNDFRRKYFDMTKRLVPNAIIHDPNTTDEHRRLVMEVCDWCIKTKRVFYTRVYLKEKKIVDIVVPSLPYPFIEVRASEEFKTKEYLSKYEGMIKFVDCSDPFKLL